MEKQRSIFHGAKMNGDRYLLMRRGKPSFPPTELDLDYDACHALVDGGYAKWLSSGYSGPGIVLTGRPLPE